MADDQPGDEHLNCLPPGQIPSFRCQADETIDINVGISLGAMP